MKGTLGNLLRTGRPGGRATVEGFPDDIDHIVKADMGGAGIIWWFPFNGEGESTLVGRCIRGMPRSSKNGARGPNTSG